MHSKRQLLQVIDTTLLKCYLEVRATPFAVRTRSIILTGASLHKTILTSVHTFSALIANTSLHWQRTMQRLTNELAFLNKKRQSWWIFCWLYVTFALRRPCCVEVSGDGFWTMARRLREQKACLSLHVHGDDSCNARLSHLRLVCFASLRRKILAAHHGANN